MKKDKFWDGCWVEGKTSLTKIQNTIPTLQSHTYTHCEKVNHDSDI